MKTRSAIAMIFAFAIFSQSAIAARNEYANIHTVAVISALGNQIDIQTDGPTVFNNNDYKLTVDWDLDAQLVLQMKAALAKQFIVQEIDPKTFPLPEKGFLDLSLQILSVIQPSISKGQLSPERPACLLREQRGYLLNMSCV